MVSRAFANMTKVGLFGSCGRREPCHVEHKPHEIFIHFEKET
jgi:hypothetical protein